WRRRRPSGCPWGYEQLETQIYWSDGRDILPRVESLISGTTQRQHHGKKVSESRHSPPDVPLSIRGGRIGNSRCQLRRAFASKLTQPDSLLCAFFPAVPVFGVNIEE